MGDMINFENLIMIPLCCLVGFATGGTIALFIGSWGVLFIVGLVCGAVFGVILSILLCLDVI